MENKKSSKNTQENSFPQDPLWKETLDLIHEVENIDFFINPKSIENLLHFNSQESRARYSRAIATRFRRIDLQILQAFHDLVKIKISTENTEQLWRILFCKIESIFAQIYLEMIWPREPGQSIERDEIKSYIQTTFPQQSKKLYEVLMLCFRKIGYLLPNSKQNLIIVGFANLEDSLVMATHLLMAREPRTIKISEIEADPYWKYLGYRKFDHVRVALRNAEKKGTIMRYAVVDHLEQITTRFKWSEYLAYLKGQG